MHRAISVLFAVLLLAPPLSALLLALPLQAAAQCHLSREAPRKALEPPIDKEQVPSLLPPPEVLGDRLNRIVVRY